MLQSVLSVLFVLSCDVPFSFAFEAPGVGLLGGTALMWTGDQCGSLFSIHTDETDRDLP